MAKVNQTEVRFIPSFIGYLRKADEGMSLQCVLI